MGLLVDGVWTNQAIDKRKAGGKFLRADAAFRNWVTADGSPGPSGAGGFEAAPGRYHLYVSYACPWAHRTLIFRQLKNLEDVIGVSVVHWFMGEQGWTFRADDGATGDPLNAADFLHQIYAGADPGYTGRASVPVLWDIERKTIVSNESSEIIRMFNSAFDEWGDRSIDLYPESLRKEIDTVNEGVYHNLNNGVYKCGFASAQEPYEQAFDALFAELDGLEARLGRNRYLIGDSLTEADWRLFPTLVRFDPVYFGHFKCNRQRIADYPNLWNYTKELYQLPGIAKTVNLHHIKHHYYASHETVNPTRIVPKGPAIDYTTPHDRARLKAA
ncbi:MAG: glutathione S-transferase family protein [Alphaproteobacteria bacterium]|nr:glutathione S-transferase family protein [Alphaproteobacteria bacterium]